LITSPVSTIYGLTCPGFARMKAGIVMTDVTHNSGSPRSYFFDEGLRFSCLRCGACCTGSSGTIYVGPEEIPIIARRLNLTMEHFISCYLYPFKDSFSIREEADGRCLFYNQGCLIYDVRPPQCRTFPFWFGNVRSEKRWIEISRECPGIGQGRLFSKEQIISMALTTCYI
jgi:Fe-S-cluster containining protein